MATFHCLLQRVRAVRLYRISRVGIKLFKIGRVKLSDELSLAFRIEFAKPISRRRCADCPANNRVFTGAKDSIQYFREISVDVFNMS